MVKYLLSFAVIFSLSLYLEGKDPAPSSADQAAAMQAFMASMQPGKQHAELAKLAGEWNCACESFMPDGSVDKSTGTAKRTMIMGDAIYKNYSKEPCMVNHRRNVHHRL